MSFYEWLKKQSKRRDATGDVARQVLSHTAKIEMATFLRLNPTGREWFEMLNLNQYSYNYQLQFIKVYREYIAEFSRSVDSLESEIKMKMIEP